MKKMRWYDDALPCHDDMLPKIILIMTAGDDDDGCTKKDQNFYSTCVFV